MEPESQEPVHLPIEDELDLHTFRPAEVPDLLDDYLHECVRAGIFSVRIIHGKGKGVQKRRVQQILARHSVVVSFRDAPSEAGGWGATVAELRPIKE
jgi:dsDNA-specific endonuclease/ATPase MutS2